MLLQIWSTSGHFDSDVSMTVSEFFTGHVQVANSFGCFAFRVQEAPKHHAHSCAVGQLTVALPLLKLFEYVEVRLFARWSHEMPAGPMFHPVWTMHSH